MTYEELLIEADKEQLIIREKDLPVSKGRIKGKKIAIRRNMTTTEKACILAEELGHYHTSVGNILNQSMTQNRKQEYHARIWGYNKMIGITGIINAYKRGCQSIHEAAKYLHVSEAYLIESITYYKRRFGLYTIVDNYIIYFEPSICVMELTQSLPHWDC